MTPRQARIVLTLTVVGLLVAATQRALAPGPVAAPPTMLAFPVAPQQSECYAPGFPGIHPVRVVDRQPAYPAAARAAGVAGTVILSIDVDESGEVRNPRVVHSIPPLDSAAVDAVSAWKFSPGRIGGRPVCVTMTVSVTFEIS